MPVTSNGGTLSGGSSEVCANESFGQDRKESVDLRSSANSGSPTMPSLDDSPELAEDAVWKRIQQNTFTRWCNEHLKCVDLRMQDMETDLSDGLLLIRLVEVLSQKHLPNHTKKPNFRSQKLENVSIALSFLEDQEDIRLVNIDSSDIVDQRLKLILGLVWTLILHYSFSMPVWPGEDEESTATEVSPAQNGSSTKTKAPKETPKQRLLGWIRSKNPNISNFTSDWNDGIALGALVDGCAPGLNPDWPDWKANEPLKNTKEAMDLAQDYLGVAKLVEPEEMINPKVDELSVMTYLAQYPNAKLRSDAPLRVRGQRPLAAAPPSFRARAYGKGLKSGIEVGSTTEFYVEVIGSDLSSLPPLDVTVQGPTGDVLVEASWNDEIRAYIVSYIPIVEGRHNIFVTFDEKHVDGSPFLVNVVQAPCDPSKVKASGPGLVSGVIAAKPTYFDVYASEAGSGKLDVGILCPDGKSTITPMIRSTEGGDYRIEYIAQNAGLHSINIFYDRQQIPGSPFGVHIKSATEPNAILSWGRGLQPRGVRVGDLADFHVCTAGAGDGKLDVTVTAPDGRIVPLKTERVDESTTKFSYTPVDVGNYSIRMLFGNEDVCRSPYEVNVKPKSNLNVRAYGPGLHGGMSNIPCDFTVETNGEVGSLGFSIEGASQAKITCKDNEDGSAEISYLPTSAGEYAVHILCDEEDIADSPFVAEVLPYKEGIRPSYVRCSGPGIDSSIPLKRGVPTEFTVDCHSAGPASLNISALDKEYNPVDVTVKNNNDQTFTCYYTPKRSVRHTISVSYGCVAVPGSPFRVDVEEPIDPAKVRIYGPGIEPGVKSQQPTHFIVDCKQAGPGEVDVRLTDDRDSALDIDVLDNHDGSFSIKYTAPRPGLYNMSVVFAGVQIPGSPIQINVQPHLNVGGVRVEGLETRVFVDCPAEFVVDARSVSYLGGRDKVQVQLLAPNRDIPVPCSVLDQKDGTFLAVFVPLEEGAHHVNVRYEQIEVPQSPMTVYAQRGFDSSKCKAFGPGLKQGFVGMNCQFTVTTKGAGQGGLSISVEGPAEAKMSSHDNRDGSCNVEYVPFEPGSYYINIRFADTHIPGSPYPVPVDLPLNASKVKAWGPGIEANHCRFGTELKFYVDASESGYAPLNVVVKSDKATAPPPSLPKIYEKSDRLYDVSYYAPPVGSWCTVHITYGEQEIPQSPIQMRVLPLFEPRKVQISGQGIVPLGKVPASIPVHFTVDTRNAGFAELEVLVMDPNDEICAVNVLDRDDGTYDVKFVPEDVGEYNIVVKYGDELIDNDPYNLLAYAIGDASKCWFMEMPENLYVGKEAFITVNAADAGNGLVTCRVRSDYQKSAPQLNSRVIDNRDGTFTGYFTPPEMEPYHVIIKYGGLLVPKGDKIMTAQSSDPSQAYPGIQLYPVEFWNIELSESCEFSKLEASVIMPSKKVSAPTITENEDGSVTVKYQPHEAGLHEMQLKHDGAHVQGSPFQFHVDSISNGYLTAFGPGLTYGTAGEPAAFTVCVREVGAGGLSVSVEGPAKAEIKCHDNKDGTCSVTWIPPAPGEYKIHVKFGEHDVKGSPFCARIAGEGRKRAHISVGSTSEVSLKIHETELKGLSASIKSPSGIEEPCFIRKIDEGHLGISFTPREAGEHLVSVKKRGTLLPEAPFRIKVGADEIGNAAKVKINGPGLHQAQTQQQNDFTVDTKHAGFGGLSVSLEGPSKAQIQCHDNKDGTCKISYKPTEPGIYVLGVKFADHHVTGSPFTVKCTGQGIGTVAEKLTKQKNQAPIVGPGHDCEFYIKLPFTTPMNLAAKLMHPEGLSEDCEMREISDFTYIIKFKPKHEGLHTISVFHKDQHVSGSPFQFTVGQFKDTGPHKVRAGGPGLTNGEVGIPTTFNVFTREAGSGLLSVAMEGPGKAKMEFKDQKDGNGYVSYTCPQAGEYSLAVKWDDKHIPDSPFKVFISPSSGEARKLEIASFPDTGLQLNKPITFTILTKGAKGHLDAKVTAPSGAQDDCFITPIDEGESYAVRLIPKEAGNHYVAITLEGSHMHDSPFRIRVGGRDESDPTAVTAHGEGLKGGETGQKCEFIINTCSAGAGNLQVSIDGPSKVTLDAYEVDIGYKVRYTPLAPGDYFMTIKYNGVHIPASPYKVTITGKAIGGSGYNESSMVKIVTVAKSGKAMAEAAPKFKSDASKVESKGVGLKKAYAGRLNNFNLDCSKAGTDTLFVQVMSSKGPAEEIHIKHQGRGSYLVNYKVKERGTTHIYVIYGDKHIPGSPFVVVV